MNSDNPFNLKMPARKSKKFIGWLDHWFAKDEPAKTGESIADLIAENRKGIEALKKETGRAVS